MTEITSTAHASVKARYGLDAPGVIRNLGVSGLLVCGLVVFFPIVKIGSLVIDDTGLIWTGLSLCFGAILMLSYSLYGKFKHRDRMLNMIPWTGNEQVLDIGTGKGLLMIGAAKRLTTGKSIGIDIWNAEDLSGNNVDNALKNAAIEGVKDKVGILNENAMQMSFADNSFDVILSNMCIHNIYNKEGRKKACEEIVRVLKPGGTALIADFRHTREYAANFTELGVNCVRHNADYFRTFPAVAVVEVKK